MVFIFRFQDHIKNVLDLYVKAKNSKFFIMNNPDINATENIVPLKKDVLKDNTIGGDMLLLKVDDVIMMKYWLIKVFGDKINPVQLFAFYCP